MKQSVKFGLTLSLGLASFSILAINGARITAAKNTGVEIVNPDSVGTELGTPSTADASGVYNGKCAKCHGQDGRGKTIRGKIDHARDLTDGHWQDDVTDERLYNSISNGRGKMPGFKKNLSDDQINALV